MATSASLARPEIQAELISEALASASVGFLVWDDHRRYIAANAAACEILGTTLEELLGQEVGAHTDASRESIDEVVAAGFASGEARVQRFDGQGPVDIFHVTFATTTAGMPFMASVIAPAAAGSPHSSA